MKTCKECGETKPLNEFYRNKTQTDGVQTYCKICESAMEKDKYISNKVKIDERNKEWYYANKSAKYKQQRAWNANNKEKLIGYWVNRRALKAGAEGYFNEKDIINLYNEQNGTCAYCRVNLSETGYHIDHIQPLSKGGSNWPDNLALACPHCNLSKKNKDLVE